MKNLFKNLTICVLLLHTAFSSFSQSLPAGVTNLGNPTSSSTHFRNKTSMVLDQSGNIWVGLMRRSTSNYSLAKYDGENWEIFSMQNSILPSDTINHMVTHGSKIFIATLKGIVIIENDNWQLFEGNTSIISPDVKTLAVTDEKLFAGTMKGLLEYSFDSKEWAHYSTANSDLISDTVQTVQPTPEGHVWVGTKYGLSFFDHEQWTNYTIQNSALPANNIRKLMLDNNGRLWVDISSQNYVFFSEGEFQSVADQLLEFTDMPSGGIYKANDGTIFLYTDLGVNETVKTIIRMQEDYYQIYQRFSVAGPIVSVAIGNKLYYSSSSTGSLFMLEFDKALPIPKESRLEINNLSSIMNAAGLLYSNYMEAMQVKNVDNASIVYSQSLWLWEKTEEGSSHLSGDMYPVIAPGYYSRFDFYPGPVSLSENAYQNDPKNWNHIWNISKEQIDYHIANYNSPDYQMPWVIANWPAHGNPALGQTSHLAPFKDLNGNTKYEPHKGEYPLIRGDQALFFIANDHRFPNTTTGGTPLGIEISGMMYGFNNPADSVLFNSVFFNYQILNRSQNLYDTLRIAAFTDFDIAQPYDDFFGCNSLLNTFYGYNGTDYCSSFGSHIPSVGTVMLNHNLQGSIIPRRSDNPGTPINQIEFQNVMQNKWVEGVPLVYGGFGYPGSPGATDQTTRFMYPGDVSDPNQWHAMSAQAVPSEIRGVGNILLNSFAPGGRICLDMAIVYARDYQGDHISSVGLMKERIQEVQAFYNQNYLNDCIDIMPNWVENPKPQKPHLKCYPNPAHDLLNIEYAAQSPQAIYQIFDSMGKLMLSGTFANNTTTLSISSLKPGMYFLRVVDGKQVSAQKIIKH